MVLYDDLEAGFKTKAVQPLEKKVILICKANVHQINPCSEMLPEILSYLLI